jgi:CheY-like chemotaxis protein
MRSSDRPPLLVLVVDDDADTRRSLRLLLTSWDDEAREAADEAEALRLAEEFRPDVMLVDLALPGADGCAVARGLRKLNPPSRPLLVALTAYTGPRYVQAALEAGFDHFLAKPCDPGPIDFLLRWCVKTQGRPALSPA